MTKRKGWKGEPRRHGLARKGVRTVIDKDKRLAVNNYVAKGRSLEPKYWIMYKDEDGNLVQEPAGATKSESIFWLNLMKKDHPNAYMVSNKEIEKEIEKEKNEFMKKLKANGVQSDVAKAKLKLIRKVNKSGLYENFGQKEIMELKDKYSNYRYGNPEQRKMWKKIEAFENWAENFEG